MGLKARFESAKAAVDFAIRELEARPADIARAGRMTGDAEAAAAFYVVTCFLAGVERTDVVAQADVKEAWEEFKRTGAVERRRIQLRVVRAPGGGFACRVAVLKRGEVLQ